MKKYNLLFVLLFAMSTQILFAQDGRPALKLSNELPSAGQKLTFSYDTVATILAGKKNVAAAIYFLDGKDYPVEDISLTGDGHILSGSFVVPAATKAFFIKLSNNNLVDNNKGRGFIYLVYKNGKPVEGAYAAMAYALYSGMGTALAQIKTDVPAALNLYQKEFELYPANQQDESNYLNCVILSKDAEKISAAMPKIAAMAAGNDEKRLITASSLYARLKLTKSADSVKEVIKTKFPDGEFIKSQAMIAFLQEKDLDKKEALYGDYCKKFPEAAEIKTPQENMRLLLAVAYLQKSDLENYNRFYSLLKNKEAICGYLNNVSWNWAIKGENLEEAAKLSKLSLDLFKPKLNSGAMPYYSANQANKMHQSTSDMYQDTYAYILYKQGKYAEALTYIQPLYDRSDKRNESTNEHYALVLNALGDTQKAIPLFEGLIKTGYQSADVNNAIKEAYIKTKGSDAGYDSYLAALKKAADDKKSSALAGSMIKEPAPMFALKDLSGNTVSLASLKGKIVIVDFWATWCGPCKASFPGMQMALNKYKDNPNVKFLFIDTWERDDNYLDGVKKFIADNKYTFNVLMDEKGDDGRQSKVVSAFKVSGIPTKFIIDAQGNIRFKHIGFDGTAEGLVDEVTKMIELTARQDNVDVSVKSM